MKNKFGKVPVKVGDVLSVKIVGVGVNGDGVARVDGFIIIVQAQLEIGCEVSIEITRVLAKFAFAEIVI